MGSHIRLSGRILGMQLYVDEVVTQRNPPFEKTWETVAEPRLLVIGAYRMGFTVAEDGGASRLRVFIDYALPSRGGALARPSLRRLICALVPLRMVDDACTTTPAGNRTTLHRSG